MLLQSDLKEKLTTTSSRTAEVYSFWLACVSRQFNRASNLFGAAQ
ncbi:hypothetical protein [Sulfuricurvum sp.]